LIHSRLQKKKIAKYSSPIQYLPVHTSGYCDVAFVNKIIIAKQSMLLWVIGLQHHAE